MTICRKYLNIDPRDYDIHLNFPGGIPQMGHQPVYNCGFHIFIHKRYLIDNHIAMTGELSGERICETYRWHCAKIEAARRAGAKTVIIPKENWQDIFKTLDINIIAVDRIEEVIEHSASIWH